MKQLIIFSISICCFCLSCNKNVVGISTQNILDNNLDGYYDGKKLSASMERYLERLERDSKNFIFNKGPGGLKQITKVNKISENQLLINCYKKVA